MAMTSEEIKSKLAKLHEWFVTHQEHDPKETIRNSVAIAQRALLSSATRVENQEVLLDIVINELFEFDKNKEPIVRQAAAKVWK